MTLLGGTLETGKGHYVCHTPFPVLAGSLVWRGTFSKASLSFAELMTPCRMSGHWSHRGPECQNNTLPTSKALRRPGANFKGAAITVNILRRRRSYKGSSCCRRRLEELLQLKTPTILSSIALFETLWNRKKVFCPDLLLGQGNSSITVLPWQRHLHSSQRSCGWTSFCLCWLQMPIQVLLGSKESLDVNLTGNTKTCHGFSQLTRGFLSGTQLLIVKDKYPKLTHADPSQFWGAGDLGGKQT